MTRPPAWRRYLRFWGANIDDDVDEELRFHIEMRVEEYMARGMTEAEARRAVMARLGDLDASRAECIELGKVREKHARRADFLDGLRADLRFAFRSLARTPGWTAVALLTIALGIGATTTVFSAADTLLGLLGAVAATRLIQGMLYGVSPLDPLSFGLGAVLLLVISVIACAAPMLRATAIDPVIAIRAE